MRPRNLTFDRLLRCILNLPNIWEPLCKDYRQPLCFLTISILPGIIITWGVTRAWGNTQQDRAKLLFQILVRKENGVKTHKTKTREKDVSCLQRRHNSVKKTIIKVTYQRLQIKKRAEMWTECFAACFFWLVILLEVLAQRLRVTSWLESISFTDHT